MRNYNNIIAVLAAISGIHAPAYASGFDDRLAQAVQERNDGNIDEAITLLLSMDGEWPNNPTILRILGGCYAAKGDFETAHVTLEKAHALSPEDTDIIVAQSRAYLWSGDIVRARTYLDAAMAISPDNSDIRELAGAILAAERADDSSNVRAPQFTLVHTWSDISIRSVDRDWHQTNAAIALPVSADTTLTADIDHEDREIANDTRITGRIDRKVGSATGLYASFSVTPDSDFREKWQVRTGAQTILGGNVIALLELRHAEYRLTNVTVAEPGLGLQTSDGRYSLTLRSINLWAEQNRHRSGWATRATADLPTGPRISIGGATYPDTEAGITRRVRSAFATGAFPLNSRLTLRAGVDFERRVQTYKRTGFSLGLTWKLGK